MSAAVDIPVSADLENCFADAPEGVAETVRLAVDAGLAGCSVEDYTRRPDDPTYEMGLAVERVRAAADAAHASPGLVLTARAEGRLRTNADLGDLISRLEAYQEAGADVLFAPGVVDLDEVRTLVAAVDLPVNVLPRPDSATVAELGAAGVKRISVGGGLAWVAYGAAVTAATELLAQGTYGWAEVGAPMREARAAFTPS
jgi:2-methylisocitrate lyase-like PEP mutase family enzyme